MNGPTILPSRRTMVKPGMVLQFDSIVPLSHEGWYEQDRRGGGQQLVSSYLFAAREVVDGKAGPIMAYVVFGRSWTAIVGQLQFLKSLQGVEPHDTKSWMVRFGDKGQDPFVVHTPL